MSDMQADSPLSATPETPETQGPGHALAMAREARSLSIAEVAMRLKFAPRQIEALEADEYGQLPGIAIVRGMVRSYARLLEVDSTPLIAELEQRVQQGPNTVHPVDMHIPLKESKKDSRVLLVLSLIVLLAVGAFALDWYVRDRRATQNAAQSVAQRPVATPAVATVKPIPVSQSAEAAETPTTEPAVAIEQALATSPVAVSATTSEPAPTQAAVAAAMPETPAAATPETPASALASAESDKRLQMRFSDQVWVEVKDGQGKVLVSRLAPANSELALDGEPPLSVVLGNAAAASLSYEGKPVDLAPHSRTGVARLKLE